MARATIQTRMGTVFLVMLLLTLAGVVLAQSRPQPESGLAPASTLGVPTTIAFDPSYAAPKAEPWFRIAPEWVRAEGASPLALADTNPAPNPQKKVPLVPPAVQVPEAVQNLRRVD